jgi:uncharacterized protein (TIGR03435 family)
VRCLITVVTVFASAAILSAQNTPADPRFDVASIKRNTSDAGPNNPQRVRVTPEGLTIHNGTVRTAILLANPDTTNVEGAPDWVGDGRTGDRFDIEARTSGPSSRTEVVAMLRALLLERFNLQGHSEQRPQNVYALTIARDDGRLGPGLRLASADCATLQERATQSQLADPCGIGGIASAQITGRMSGRGLTLDQLAGFLVREVRTPVSNQTGLTGAFDWDLTFTPQTLARPDLDRTRFATIDPNGPLVFTAVQEQLGLKLEREQGSVTVLVIDHIERPSEN